MEPEQTTLFGVRCHRSQMSICGEKSAWLKAGSGSDAPRLFQTLEEARAEVKRITATMKSPHVSYVAREYDPSI